ncbi:MAG: IPT/TIG domain-containing protein [Bacteroidales bacterium]|jgi:hypothetical protein|nr:IPT/TIG domain-containing protein [Bacteroidales bacterium]
MNTLSKTKNRKKSSLQKRCIVCAGIFLCLFSCNDKNETGATAEDAPPYDPNQPVELTRFYPDSGGMATKIILEGNNFGNDPEKIRVYYNRKRAAVVKVAGDLLYAITPRQPGDTCVISVAIGTDSISYPETFEYTTEIGVSTVTGQKGSTEHKEGTLNEARFVYPQHVAVDPDGNVYVAVEGQGLWLVSEEKNTVMKLIANTTTYNAPTLDLSTGRHILLPQNNPNTYLRISIDDAFSIRTYNPQRVPNPEKGINSWNNNFKHQFASCRVDSMIYFGSRTDSYVVQINPNTKEMKPVFDLRTVNGVNYQSNYFAMFHPIDHHMLYLSVRNLHSICTYNILTGEFAHYAGTYNSLGHVDGDRLTAKFNEPCQVDFDQDGNMYVADKNNHCIRKINPDGVVTTVVGIPGVSGYLDGTRDNAMFNTPWGVAVAKDGSVYVSDRSNNTLRKLSIQ